MIYLIIKPRSKILRTTIKYMSFDNIGISNVKYGCVVLP